MGVLSRLWNRYVRRRPESFRAYVSLPTADGRPSVGEAHDCIADLERVFEGRLDVYARVRGLAVVSDSVDADQFDRDAFEAAIERLEACYDGTHTLARLEKRRHRDGRLVTTFVVVPVRPLFPPARREDDRRVRPAVE